MLPARLASVADPLRTTLDVLARRGALDVCLALEDGALSERALLRRLSTLAPSVVSQRVADLRRIDVVEVVRESDELRLSAQGRRLQDLLTAIGSWATGTAAGTAGR